MPEGEWEHGKQKATLAMLDARLSPCSCDSEQPLAPAASLAVLELKLVFQTCFESCWKAKQEGGAWRGFVKLKLAVCQWSDPTPTQLPAGEPSVIQDLDVRHSHWGMTDAGWGRIVTQPLGS